MHLEYVEKSSMILQERFKGCIVYASPESGKTYLSERYKGVIDGDDELSSLVLSSCTAKNLENY